MKATYLSYVWEWDEEFTINSDDVTDVNTSATVKESNLLLYIILGIILFIILLTVAFLLGRKTSKEDREQGQKESEDQGYEKNV